MKWVFGSSDINRVGWQRSWRGLRTGEQRDLYLGLGLVAIGFLRRTGPRKQLIYRKTVDEGSALVIHHKGPEDPHLTVIRPE